MRGWIIKIKNDYLVCGHKFGVITKIQSIQSFFPYDNYYCVRCLTCNNLERFYVSSTSLEIYKPKEKTRKFIARILSGWKS